MFTGLIAARGVLEGRTARGPGARLAVRAAFDEPLALGESVACDGACLSVLEVTESGFTADATVETLARTTLGALPLGHSLNLERSLRAGDRLGGHLVSGHVDAVGFLEKREEAGEAVALSFTLPQDLALLVAEKGSIAINGVSMTVNAARGGGQTAPGRGEPEVARQAGFDVMVIPITQRETNLGALRPGDRVNLEVDLVARYVARLLGKA